MSDCGQAKKYDLIFIGTSMICVLEAVYQRQCGKSVLMLDQQEDMGGAWLTLNIFGLHDVENAIHYFLPDSYAFDFMKNTLAWDIIPSPRKYRVFPLPFGTYWTVPYDNAFGRLLGKTKVSSSHEKKWGIPPNFLRTIKEIFFEPRQPSYYVRGGTPEMLRKVKSILLASKVEVKYSTIIDRIHINNQIQIVEVTTKEEKFYSNTIYFTHGSRISNLTDSSGPFPIQEKSHPRPAVHLLVRDASPSRMHECILTSDPLIKYVHDVTHFSHESAELVGRKKILVLALHQDVRKKDDIYRTIFERLKQVGMVSEKAVLENHYWQDIFLPRLDDADLHGLKDSFGSQVELLKTEDFARGIGYHARKWATRIRFPETDLHFKCDGL
jgi:hypothetical protein